MVKKREHFLILLTEVTWWVGGVLAALVQVGSRWIEISFEIRLNAFSVYFKVV